ncbi:MBL fold metallo-hydrolase [Oceanobacillus zhaokaii]|uniref:MBL fold metallo-hydrolase n=1 Tax=Oceanobacillus zhaokaii TaxID=2052660 RepID=A0A345PFQ3_9BACI|nr:MBL fold metallo-hydrolase [Oceanobacillus zhaokaii]AXI08833.1 MBL fold metallo-hydrolase [Oceanobacillus zhaokaii]
MDKDIFYGEDYKYIPATSIGSGRSLEVLPDILCHTIQIVNICIVGNPNTKDFVLVDTGMPKSADKIISVVEEHFGTNSSPKAIILTHGHFDHVGAIIELVKKWEVPVFAHELEMPYLTGKMSYAEPDASVEGGLIAKMSQLFPNESINLGDHVQVLPADGSVPYLSDFRWVHTPGHSPGHISLFRDEDGVLIAGDAFVTVKQDSLYKVVTQEMEINGPPRYFTIDWNAARKSVEKLQDLKPNIVIPGHGRPVSGETLSKGLQKLVREFDEIAVPDYGKYVDNS